MTVTLYTVPKAFDGHIGTIQENAIRSWQRLTPRPEILLFGDDPGVADAAERLGVRHVPEVPRNAYGTPLLGGVFRMADGLATHGTIGFVNTDIVFLTDFLRLLRHVPAGPFLVIGQRFDLRVEETIPYEREGWQRDLYDRLVRAGSFLTMGMDYFLYPRGTFRDMPEFAIGRGFWDSWLVHSALQRGVPVLDATGALVAVHQNHDYAHVRSVPTREYWRGPEGEENLRLSGFDRARPPNFYDARFLLTADGLKPARGPFHRAQRLYDFTSRHRVLRPFFYGLKLVRKAGPFVHRFRRPRPAFDR